MAGHTEPFGDKKKIIIGYVLLMLGTGIWQLADWYYGNEDPIWHLFFYFLIMPTLSFALGLLTADDRRFLLIPFGAAVLSALIYIFMANGGFSIDTGALQLCVPTFIAATIGVMLRRVIMWWSRNKE